MTQKNYLELEPRQAALAMLREKFPDATEARCRDCGALFASRDTPFGRTLRCDACADRIMQRQAAEARERDAAWDRYENARNHPTGIAE